MRKKSSIAAFCVLLHTSPFMTVATADELNWKCFMDGPGGRGSTSLPNSYLFVASDEIKRQTNGQLVISPAPGQALGFSSSDIVRSLHFGLIPMADFSAGDAAGEIPTINLLELPGVLPWGNVLLAKETVSRWMPYWKDDLHKKNIELLAAYFSVGRNIFTTNNICNSATDLEYTNKQYLQ